MTPNQPPQQAAPKRLVGRMTFVIWAVAIALVVAAKVASPLLRVLHFPSSLVDFGVFVATSVIVGITLYWIALALRFMLRRLFWRVGRRLLLSYVLIGGLPFLLVAVLIVIICYMIGGVMTQAALRGERRASLGQMEAWSMEYALLDKKPTAPLPSLEIYDTEKGDDIDLPEWLRRTTFSGMVWRDGQALLVCARQYGTPSDPRTVIFAQPLDHDWAKQLEENGGMIIAYGRKKSEDAGDASKSHNTITLSNGTRRTRVEFDEDESINRLLRNHLGRGIIWGDLTDLTEWNSGKTTKEHQVFTMIFNPVPNLFQFYFGSSGQYFHTLLQVIAGLTVLLLVIYLIAAMFAAVLIFSISRAVNRIEKGTKAVERGDFTYRIGMKPRNQLGEMAQSFDHMTASISSLLVTVAEKERLQSEIEIAASIQRNLLPKEGPQFRGVSFSAHFEPTTAIGGDYYDVFNLDKTKLAVAIGDVSGHGLSTGLVMAMVKAAITTLVEEGAEETSLFRRLNDLVFRSTERRAFMTLAFTIFDIEHGTIRHTNAGHLYPYLLRAGQAPLAIESPSLPLGVRSEIVSRTVELPLQEGDTVVYLSDGIVEAQNNNGDPFGFDQLESLLAGAADLSPSAVRDSILSAVARHSGSRPADDDRTVMIISFDQLRGVTRIPEEQPLAIAAPI
jgi:serine phosphatase RsbU (regulator of sigma subunit)